MLCSVCYHLLFLGSLLSTVFNFQCLVCFCYSVCDSENESLSRKRNKSWYYLYRVDRNGVTEEEEGVRRRGVVQFYHESVTMFSISI